MRLLLLVLGFFVILIFSTTIPFNSWAQENTSLKDREYWNVTWYREPFPNWQPGVGKNDEYFDADQHFLNDPRRLVEEKVSVTSPKKDLHGDVDISYRDLKSGKKYALSYRDIPNSSWLRWGPVGSGGEKSPYYFFRLRNRQSGIEYWVKVYDPAYFKKSEYFHNWTRDEKVDKKTRESRAKIANTWSKEQLPRHDTAFELFVNKFENGAITLDQPTDFLDGGTAEFSSVGPDKRRYPTIIVTLKDEVEAKTKGVWSRLFRRRAQEIVREKAVSGYQVSSQSHKQQFYESISGLPEINRNNWHYINDCTMEREIRIDDILTKDCAVVQRANDDKILKIYVTDQDRLNPQKFDQRLAEAIKKFEDSEREQRRQAAEQNTSLWNRRLGK